MNIKNNKRFRNTEIRMESVMLSLMKNTKFEKITVKKICEKANVNRSTFYAHFIDIYDMLDKMEKELSKQLLEKYVEKDERAVFSEKSFIVFLEHIKKHKYFYRINLKNRREFPIKLGFEGLWNIIEKCCNKAGVFDKEEIMYYFIGFQSSFTMILKHWVDTDCKLSEKELANLIKNCLPNILVKSGLY